MMWYVRTVLNYLFVAVKIVKVTEGEVRHGFAIFGIIRNENCVLVLLIKLFIYLSVLFPFMLLLIRQRKKVTNPFFLK